MSATHTPDPAAAGSELPPGARLREGRYAVERVLGRGGFGITYRAEDLRLQRWVAVKELAPPGVVRHEVAGPGGLERRVVAPAHLLDDFRGARERFLREAHALGRFDHPGIVRVYEVFEESGTAYLVCEYLHGPSLAGHLVARGRALTEAEALELARGVGVALVHVHAAGMLHRDVSPSNIVLVGTGDGGVRPVLIDFGLARTFAGDGTEALTRMVTPGFAPIEQYGGQDRIGPPADVYGLAATLYHGLSGSLPPSAVDRQAGTALPSLRHRRPDVSRLVADAVHDGLELDARHRPESVAAFLARLGISDAVPAALRPTSAAPTPPPPPAPPTAPVPGVAPPAPDFPRVAPTPAPAPARTPPGWEAPRRPPPPPMSAPAPPPVPSVHGATPPPPVGVWGDGAVLAPDTRLDVALRAGATAARAEGAWPPPGATAALGADGPASPSARRWVAWPLAALGAALVAAAPLLGLALLLLVALPVLATVGDHRRRRRHRVMSAVSAPFLLVRNAGRAFVAAASSVVVVGGAVVVALALRAAGADGAGELALRLGGAAAGLVAWSTVDGDRARFAAADVVDGLAAQLVDRGGRPGPGALGLVGAAALAALAAATLSPDLWPLG